MGPGRNTHLRNVAILLVLALAVWLIPGGDTASTTIYNLLTVVFVAGLLFLGYRLYMERRSTLFMLEDRMRGLLYASLGLAAFAVVATSRLWQQGGFGGLIWIGLLTLAGWGVYRVYRASREY